MSLDLQVVAVSPEQAQKLIPRLRDAKTFATAYAELQQMIERDEADLVAWPVLVTREGQRAESESIVEERYPAEFQPPQIPQTFGVKIPPDPNSDAAAPEWELTPTAFEVRNAGLTFASDCAVSNDGKRISLGVEPQWVRLLNFQTFAGPRLPCGICGIEEQPEFATSKVTEELTLQSGGRILLGAFTQNKPRPHVALFLLKAAAERIDHQSGKP